MKKSNNKGFSLVELIVVVAIMAVLVGVLAPAYLKYVENSRIQKDISAVGEVVNAIKIAAANEEVAAEIPAATENATEIALPALTGATTELAKELNSIVDKVEFTSKEFTKQGATPVTVSVKTGANGNLDITVTGPAKLVAAF